MVAAGGVALALLPRGKLTREHASEGKAAWIDGFDSYIISVAFANEGYISFIRLFNPQTRMTLGHGKTATGRYLANLLYGSRQGAERYPWLAYVRPLATVAACTIALFLINSTVVSPEEKAYRNFFAHPDASAASAFLAHFPASSHRQAVEEETWRWTQQAASAEAYSAYLANFPAGPHASEARLGPGGKAFDAVRRNPTVASITAFLQQNPDSPQRRDAIEILLKLVLQSPPPSSKSPPAEILRRLFDLSSKGTVGIRVSWNSSTTPRDSYRDQVIDRLRQGLASLGLRLDTTSVEGVLVVEGTDRTDDTRGYGGTSGPDALAEEVTVKISVQFPGDMTDAWSTTVHASSPAAVMHSGLGIVQEDVHRATMSDLQRGTNELFQYR